MEEEKDFIKEKLKKAIVKKLIAFSLPLLPYIIFMGAIVSMIVVILLPFMGIFGIPSEDKNNMTQAATSFQTKLDEKLQYWLDRDVEIDKTLLLAVIFYEEPIDESSVNCSEENIENCISSERNYKELEKEIEPLADNMVKERTLYYCKSEVQTKELVCSYDDDGILTDDCIEKAKTTFAEPIICGSNIDTCKTVCTGNYQTTEEIDYFLKPEWEYIEWLKTDFLPTKMVRLGFTIPSDSESFYEDIIADIYSIRAAFSDSNNVARFLGDPMYSFGEAGPIDPNILSQLQSPLGEQACNQTSCYGYYGVNNCATHNGIDIGANGGSPDLYSIFNGKVIAITYGTGNCKPNFSETPKCAPGCNATIVLIEHTIVINDKTTKFYSRYVHLSSVAPGISIDTEVVKGQKIGVMGNTGCSTSTHLHFEIWNSERKRHNPEELFNSVGCSMMNSCSEARFRCGV